MKLIDLEESNFIEKCQFVIQVDDETLNIDIDPTKEKKLEVSNSASANEDYDIITKIFWRK